MVVGCWGVSVGLSVASCSGTTFSLAFLNGLCDPRLGSIQLCKAGAHSLQLFVDSRTSRWQGVGFPQFPWELEIPLRYVFQLCCCELVAVSFVAPAICFFVCRTCLLRNYCFFTEFRNDSWPLQIVVAPGTLVSCLSCGIQIRGKLFVGDIIGFSSVSGWLSCPGASWRLLRLRNSQRTRQFAGVGSAGT